MKLSIHWLKTFIAMQLENDKLVHKLTMSGLEVEGLVPLCASFSHVVVGKILTVKTHNNATKLKVCQVDIGKEVLQIVCAAPNIKVGLLVGVATVGAKLANNILIKETKIRGFQSSGMICSADELGLNECIVNEKSDGILVLDDALNIGEDLRSALNLNDYILTLDITPNRGDCFSLLGIAREVANYENIELKKEHTPSVTVKTNTQKIVHIEADKACPKYLVRAIVGVDNTVKTPKWMRERLLRSGQKLHSLAVDVTNHTLLELGQPLHSFDLDKIAGDVSVRFAHQNENFTTLEGKTLALNTDTLVIVEENSVLAMAGIIGGLESATQLETKNILLESAFFDLNYIAGKARKYGLHTESSLRFERGVDFEITRKALERASALIIEIAGGQAGAITEKVSKAHLPKLPHIYLRKARISQVLGFELKHTWILAQFKNLQFKLHDETEEYYLLTPPSFRFDLRLEVDLIEELARLYGYDNLPAHKFSTINNIQIEPQVNKKDDLVRILVDDGYFEVVNYSFISKIFHERLYPDVKPLVLDNPISTEMSVMRTSLIAGLLKTLQHNKRYGFVNIRLFEIGLCFHGTKPDAQIEKIAGVMSGNYNAKSWYEKARVVDFFDIKGAVERLVAHTDKAYYFKPCKKIMLHPGQSCDIYLHGKKIGFMGALSPKLENILSLNNIYLFELEYLALQNCGHKYYQPYTDFQAVRRDIAILLARTISFTEVSNAILSLGQAWLVDVKLFDVYTDSLDGDKKSLALTLIYKCNKRTLIDSEIDKNIAQVLAILEKKFSAIQR